MASEKAVQTLAAGKYLHLVRRDHWEWARRPAEHDAVCIIATDEDQHILFVEQYRYPLDSHTIELPAGLVGDEPTAAGEHIITAAKRELEEETGYCSDDWHLLGRFASSAGMTSEAPAFAQASQCQKVSAGGGVDDEDIVTHCVPLASAEAWLAQQQANGLIVDVKVLVGLAFARGLLKMP